MRNIWTEEELNYVRDNYLSQSDEEMALTLIKHTPLSIGCKRKRMGLIRSNRKYSFADVVAEFNKTNYILLSDETDYKDAATNSLKYICPIHADKGVQTISLGHLQSGRGCYYCGRQRTEDAHKRDLESHIEAERLCQDKGLTYVDSIRENGLIYVRFICPQHPYAGIQKMKYGGLNRDFIDGCPYCTYLNRHNATKGEQAIIDVFEEFNILFLPQYRFEHCKSNDGNMLFFDFYLPEYNICIEYDGAYHYKPIKTYGRSEEEAQEQFRKVRERDKIKNDFCQENNIGLLRIPYTDFKNVRQILINQLQLTKIA